MNGYAGKIVIADLTDKTYEIHELDPDWARYYLGGSALGARFLYDLMPKGTPVFAPESVVGFVSGPTNATRTFYGRTLLRCQQISRDGRLERRVGGRQFRPLYA